MANVYDSKLLKLLNIVFDFLIFVAIYHTTFWLKSFEDPLLPDISSTFGIPILLNSAMGISLLYIYGVYSLKNRQKSEYKISIIISCFVLLILSMSISFFIRNFAFPRSVFLGAFIIQFIFMTFYKGRIFSLAKKSASRKKAVILYSAEEELSLIEKFKYAYSNEIEIVGKYNIDMIKNLSDDILENFDLLLIQKNLFHKIKTEDILDLNEKELFIVPNVSDLLLNNMKTVTIDDVPTLYHKPLGLTPEQKFIKRLFDFILALLMLVISLPFWIIIFIAIKLDSRGPVFYKQDRITENDKVFKVYKFRTMFTDAEKNTGPVLATQNDSRVTRVGKIIRATRLDELPQLINVIKGEMSLVGPRPERPKFVDEFNQIIPEYKYRHKVKAGITGLAQIKGKYSTSVYDKLIFDLAYISEYSLMKDFMILMETLKVVFVKTSST